MESHNQVNIKKKLLWSLLLASVILCGLIWPHPLFSKEVVQEFSLEQARQWAIKHSFEMKQSRLDLEVSKKKLLETLAMGLPQVSATINYMNNLELAVLLIPDFFGGDLDKKIPVQFGTQHNVTASLQVNQLLFSSSYLVGLQTSRIFKKLAEKGFDQTKLTVQETVSSTYYLILVTQESESILSERLKTLKKTHAEIREYYNEGFVEETDVDLLQISVTRLKNALQNISQQKGIVLKLLKFQMGLELDARIKLSDSLPSILIQINIPSLLKTRFDLQNNIGYQLLNTQEKLMQMAFKYEKSKYLPTVSAFYTYQGSAMRDTFNFFNSDEDWFRAQILGVNMMIPIFQSGGQKARIQQAAITWEKAKQTLQQAGRGLILESEQSKTNLRSAYENYLNMKANMKLSEKVYNKTLTKYREGVASSMDLSQIHDNYLASQNEYIQGVSNLLNAKNKWDSLLDNFNSIKKGK